MFLKDLKVGDVFRSPRMQGSVEGFKVFEVIGKPTPNKVMLKRHLPPFHTSPPPDNLSWESDTDMTEWELVKLTDVDGDGFLPGERTACGFDLRKGRR